jgi:hypothetical protein
VIAPGLIVHVPEGKPLNRILPVETAQVGWVTVPTVGVAGVAGRAVIMTPFEEEEIQPEALVTIKV